MSAAIFRAFGTPLYKDRVQLNKKEINPILSNMKFRRLQSDDGWASEDVYVLENELSCLKSTVQEKLDDFMFNHFKLAPHYEVELQNSWVMKHKHGDSSALHWHSNGIVSGILYLQTDPNSGALAFVSQLSWTNNMFLFDYTEDNPLNQTTVVHTPLDGEIILFPSKTYHTVTPSQSEHMRFCLAFNAFIRGPSNVQYPESMSQLVL